MSFVSAYQISHLSRSLYILLLLFFLFVSNAVADITVLPARVIFEGKARVVELWVKKTTEGEQTYGLSYSNQHMQGDGRLVETKLSGAQNYFVNKMVRLSPRRFTLNKGESQTIRLFLRKPRNLVPGEYLSHLSVNPVIYESEASIDNLVKQYEGNRDKVVRSATKTVFGLQIPVIVRHGELTGRCSIREHSFTNKNTLQVRFDWQGNKFFKGFLATSFAPISRDGDVKQYPFIIYRNLDSRNVEFNVEIPSSQAGRTMYIACAEENEEKGMVVHDKTTIRLP